LFKPVAGCRLLRFKVFCLVVLHFCRGLQVEDAITEALENDNLQLQNMSGQKYVQLNTMFLDAVANWQKKLGTVDSVLATWTDVQKKWQALESIFVGSADIRVQLPDDSKRFDVINADYQVRDAGL
jgi:dynein heavy chain